MGSPNGTMFKLAMKAAGIDPDANLPELIGSLNEKFGLGLTVTEAEPTMDGAVAAFTQLAEVTQSAIANAGAKLYKVSAAPVGKPKVTAFIVVG